MRIAVYTDILVEGGNPATLVEDVAKELGNEPAEVITFQNSIDLLDKLAPSGSNTLDLVILPYELPGVTGLHAIEEARATAPLLRVIMFDDTPEHVALAASAGINSYLVQPVSIQKFRSAVKTQLSEIARIHSVSFLLNTRTGVSRVPFCKVLYCETSGHDQIVHMMDGSSIIGRYSSQGMFDLLAENDRFYKVGSSYIVNLDEVCEAHIPNGTMTLSDGEVLNIPSRLRKSFEGVLLGSVA